jgi:hypothetical protein
MTHTLVIETQAETDYQLLLGLAHRLGLRVRESNETSPDDADRQVDTKNTAADPTKRPLGTMKGSFRLAPDFDEPLDDLKDYM